IIFILIIINNDNLVLINKRLIFKVYKRPDQDSGMGRTTDESARTEESSEQKHIDFTHGLTHMTTLINENDPVNNNSSDGISLSQDNRSSLTIPSDVFTDYDAIDPIDQELVQLGRLMQSLAVHCRQLVHAKLQYNRIQHPLSVIDNSINQFNERNNNSLMQQSQTMSTKVTSVMNSATVTSITMSTTPSTKASSQLAENCCYGNNLHNTKCIISKSNEGISLNGSPLPSTKDNNNMSTRLPRMGTRMEPSSIMGSISSNDSSGSFHEKNSKMATMTTSTTTTTIGDKLSFHNRFPSNIRDSNMNYTESYYTSIRQFDSPPSSLSLISSRNNNNKSSNEQLPSTSDNNSNTTNLQINNSFNYNSSVLNEQKRNVNHAKEVLLKANMKLQKSSDNHHHQQKQHNLQKFMKEGNSSCDHPQEYPSRNCTNQDSTEKSITLMNHYENKIGNYSHLHFNSFYPTPLCNGCYPLNHIKYVTPLKDASTTLHELSSVTNNSSMNNSTFQLSNNHYNNLNKTTHSYEFYDSFCYPFNKTTTNTIEQQSFTCFNDSMNTEKVNVIVS
ncbi:PDZ domain-containing protein 4, partial [Schistosoma japonicum]